MAGNGKASGWPRGLRDGTNARGELIRRQLAVLIVLPAGWLAKLPARCWNAVPGCQRQVQAMLCFDESDYRRQH